MVQDREQKNIIERVKSLDEEACFKNYESLFLGDRYDHVVING